MFVLLRPPVCSQLRSAHTNLNSHFTQICIHPCVYAAAAFTLHCRLILLSLPFISIFTCCVPVLFRALRRAVSSTPRGIKSETSSHHMSLAPSRFLASLLSLFSSPFSLSPSFLLYWFISPSFFKTILFLFFFHCKILLSHFFLLQILVQFYLITAKWS